MGRLDTQTDTDESNNVLASYDYTVRADGKRTSLNETHWFDENQDGNVDNGEQKTTAFSWTYDPVGRLTDEAIDHWNNAFDQTESFTYDLTGNRLQLDRDHGNNGVDEVITYDYDANDRLLEEVLDDLVNNADDTTTTYAYDHTQQTEKIVTRSVSEATVSKQLFTFNLQGRIATVINEGYTDGTLSSRERTGYEYNSGSYRFSLLTHDGTTLGALETETWNLKSETSFLADSRNFTGYTQTLRESTVNADGTTKTVNYTFGQDEIAQRSVERDDQGAITSDETLVFGHDGHGSVRVLYDLAEATAGLINQVATFAAYGQVIAIHAANAAVAGTSEASFKSNLGYSGEQWDASLRMQNLRARAYDPRNGRFIGLDPFAGNMQDPLSLHKYAYVHGDPVQGADPSGEFTAFAHVALATSITVQMAAPLLVPLFTIGAIGFGVGIGINAIRNRAIGRPAFDGWFGAGATGFLAAPFAIAMPEVALMFAAMGIIDSVQVAAQICDDPATKPEQYGWSLAYIALSVFFARSTVNAIETPPSPFSVQNGVIVRRNMQWRTITDVNGKPVTIYGQGSRSSSTTPGHGETIEALAQILAATGRYTDVIMQRSWRTSTDRVVNARGIPDITLIGRDGKVSVVEVYSLTDTPATIDTRVISILKGIGPDHRGDYRGINAATDVSTLSDPFAGF